MSTVAYMVVSQASPCPFRSADRFQYNDWRCAERVWLVRLLLAAATEEEENLLWRQKERVLNQFDLSLVQVQLTAGVVSCGCMREGSGGWRMMPRKDPTSACISGTTGKN